MSRDTAEIAKHFPIQSVVDLDFVINQGGWPIGMTRDSPPELKRRIASAVVSYQLGLGSVDYARRKFIPPQSYDTCNGSTADGISDFLKEALTNIRRQIWLVQTVGDKTYGQVSAEFSLFRAADTIRAALLLTDRGLLLEVIPIYRLALEMLAWSYSANLLLDEQRIRSLKAESCFNVFKADFRPAGRLYGLLSKFSHWRFEIHDSFLDIKDDTASSVSASTMYRALSQCICLAIVRIYLEVVETFQNNLSMVETPRGSDLHNLHMSSLNAFMEDILNLTNLEEVKNVLLCFQVT